MNYTSVGVSLLALTQRMGTWALGDLDHSACLWLQNKQQPEKWGSQTSGNNRGFGDLDPT